MTKQEKHELRIKIAKLLKSTNSQLNFVEEEDLVLLETTLREILTKSIL